MVDYLTTLGTLDLTSLSKEAEERRVKLRQELIEILSASTDELVNGDAADGGSVPDVAKTEDVGAEDYEIPTLSGNKKEDETDRQSTASAEKKSGSKSSVTHSKSNVDMKAKKRTLSRAKSSQIVELPSKDDRRKEGYLTEKKLMRRTVQHWVVLSPDMLYLARGPTDTVSEAKVPYMSVTQTVKP